MRTYLTAAELSRSLNIPQSRLTAALDAGIIAADGRAGNASNSAIIFAFDRLDAIKTAIENGTPAPQPTPSRDIREFSAKAAALHRAKEAAE